MKRLGEPLSTQLADFCAANYGASAVGVTREALREFMAKRLEDTETNHRYNDARMRRLRLEKPALRLIK